MRDREVYGAIWSGDFSARRGVGVSSEGRGERREERGGGYSFRGGRTRAMEGAGRMVVRVTLGGSTIGSLPTCERVGVVMVKVLAREAEAGGNALRLRQSRAVCRSSIAEGRREISVWREELWIFGGVAIQSNLILSYQSQLKNLTSNHL